MLQISFELSLQKLHMEDAFDLSDSEYAKEITKLYDFLDDYFYTTQMYKHSSEDTVMNMLSFAVLEAEKKESERLDQERLV